MRETRAVYQGPTSLPTQPSSRSSQRSRNELWMNPFGLASMRYVMVSKSMKRRYRA